MMKRLICVAALAALLSGGTARPDDDDSPPGGPDPPPPEAAAPPDAGPTMEERVSRANQAMGHHHPALAIEWILKALEKDPAFEPYRLAVAETWMELGVDEEATRVLQKLAETPAEKSRAARALFDLGTLALERGQAKEAVSFFLKSLEIQRTPTASFRLAVATDLAYGDRAAARRNIQDCLVQAAGTDGGAERLARAYSAVLDAADGKRDAVRATFKDMEQWDGPEPDLLLYFQAVAIALMREKDAALKRLGDAFRRTRTLRRRYQMASWALAEKAFEPYAKDEAFVALTSLPGGLDHPSWKLFCYGHTPPADAGAEHFPSVPFSDGWALLQTEHHFVSGNAIHRSLYEVALRLEALERWWEDDLRLPSTTPPRRHTQVLRTLPDFVKAAGDKAPSGVKAWFDPESKTLYYLDPLEADTGVPLREFFGEAGRALAAARPDWPAWFRAGLAGAMDAATVYEGRVRITPLTLEEWEDIKKSVLSASAGLVHRLTAKKPADFEGDKGKPSRRQAVALAVFLLARGAKSNTVKEYLTHWSPLLAAGSNPPKAVLEESRDRKMMEQLEKSWREWLEER